MLGLRYPKELLESSRRHLNQGIYSLAVYEAREAALYALSVLGARRSHSLVESYAELIKDGRVSRDLEVMLCCQLLDRLGPLELEGCNDVCADELPSGGSEEDIGAAEAEGAVRCARIIVSVMERTLAQTLAFKPLTPVKDR